MNHFYSLHIWMWPSQGLPHLSPPLHHGIMWPHRRKKNCSHHSTIVVPHLDQFICHLAYTCSMFQGIRSISPFCVFFYYSSSNRPFAIQLNMEWEQQCDLTSRCQNSAKLLPGKYMKNRSSLK